MPSLSRRGFLGSAATLLVGASGCTTSADEETPTPTPTHPVQTESVYDRCIPDPPSRMARHPDGEAPIRSSEHTPTVEWTDTEWVVANSDQRDALEYFSDASGIVDVEQFVTDTDLSAHSLLIHQYTGECLMLDPVRFKFDESGDRTSNFAMEYDDVEPDGDCGNDNSEQAGVTVLRVPVEVEEVGGLEWATFQLGQNTC